MQRVNTGARTDIKGTFYESMETAEVQLDIK